MTPRLGPGTVVLLFLTAVLAGGPVPALAQAAATTTQTMTPVMIVVPNECTGEDVTLTGIIHTMTHVTNDQNGGIHFSLRGNAQAMSGVSPSGVTYQATRNLMFEIDGRGVPSTSTVVQSFNLVSRGSTDNFLVHIISHITVNANGETTVEIAASRYECR